MSTTPEVTLSLNAHQERITKLRAELKDWEHAFAKTHDGRKPTREETKKDKEIAAKYKEYSRLRAASSSSIPATSTNHQLSEKQSRSSARHITPPIPEINQTPTKNKTDVSWGNELIDSPLSARRQRLLNRRDQVGPTPQKTGRVLGIFDSFIDVESTPPRSTQRGQIEQGTPSKTKKDRVSASPSPRIKEDETSPFLTPRKRKLGEMNTAPRSGGGRGNVFATPSALREWKPPTVDGELDSPQVRRPPPMPKRGLSSMLKELREMEDHALDDEEEAMREMEAEAAGQLPVRKPKKTASIFDQPELPPLPPGAFVEETPVHGHDEEGEKTWKKKGLKRQHKRVIMRPVVVKSKSEKDTKGLDEQSIPSDVEHDYEAEAASADEHQSTIDENSEDDDEDAASKAKRAKGAVAVTTVTDKKGVVKKGKEAVKRAARKISANATSHMNFRKLNIKNKNSKGKGRGGNFGRRR